MESISPVFRSGNIAVITGAASGIGLALSRKCASYGMKVIMADIDKSNLSAAKLAIHGQIESFHLDVSKIEDYEALKARIVTDFGGKFNL